MKKSYCWGNIKNNYDFTNKLLPSYKKKHTQKVHKCYRNLSEQNNIWKILIIKKKAFLYYQIIWVEDLENVWMSK